MKKKLVGVLVAILTLALGASAFGSIAFDQVKFSGDVTFSVSSAAPAGLLNGSSSAALVVEELKKNGDSWSASSAGWIKYAGGLATFELNKALSNALYDLDANIPSNPGVKLGVGPVTLVVNNQEDPVGSGKIAYNFGGGLSFGGDNYSLGVMANYTPITTSYCGTSYGAKVTGSFAPFTLTGEVGKHANQLAYYLKGVYGLGAGNLVASYKNAFSGTTTLYGGLEDYQIVKNTKFTVSATNATTLGVSATTYLAKTVTTIASMMDLTLQVTGAPVVGTATLKVSF